MFRLAPNACARLFLSLLLLCLISLEVFAVTPIEGGSGGIRKIILSRAVDDLQIRYSSLRAEEYLKSQKPNGSWADISYKNDLGGGEWLAVEHLNRTLSIALAIRNLPAGEEKSKAISSVKSSLLFWKNSLLVSKNWWYSDIGVPLKLAQIAVVLEKDVPLPFQEMARRAKVGSIRSERDQGQNFVWYREIAFLNAVLSGDVGNLRKSVADLRSSIKIQCGVSDGIKQDLSFHQHGGVFYSGAYGLNFLFDLARLSFFVTNTELAFSEKENALLVDYLLDGIVPLVKEGWIDWSARGREFGRVGATAKALSSLKLSAQYLSKVTSHRRSELVRINSDVGLQKESGGSINRYYPLSDFMVHKGSTSYFSVKLCSEKGVGGESFNGENQFGYWLPYGATYSFTDPGRLERALETYDWAKIPGVTSRDVVKRINGLLMCPPNQTLGVSDGSSGVIVGDMEYDGIRVKKAWFFDGETMVVVGRGLVGEIESEVISTLFQLEVGNDLRVDGKLLELSPGSIVKQYGRKIEVAGLAYTFRQEVVFYLKRLVKSDSITFSGDKVQKSSSVVAWIDHRDKEVLTGYEYSVTPSGASTEGAYAYDLFDPGDGSLALRFHKSKKTLLALSTNARIPIRSSGNVWVKSATPVAMIFSGGQGKLTGIASLERGKSVDVNVFHSDSNEQTRVSLKKEVVGSVCGMPSVFRFKK